MRQIDPPHGQVNYEEPKSNMHDSLSMHSKLDHVSIFSKHSGDQEPQLNDSFDKDVADI